MIDMLLTHIVHCCRVSLGRLPHFSFILSLVLSFSSNPSIKSLRLLFTLFSVMCCGNSYVEPYEQTLPSIPHTTLPTTSTYIIRPVPRH